MGILGSASALPNVTLGFGRDADGNRTSLTDPTGTTAYSHDTLDRLTSIQNPLGEVYSFGYDAGSRLSSIARPGGNTVLTFDDANFLSSILHSSSGSQIASYHLQRDALGRRIQKQVTDSSAQNDPTKTFNRRYVYDGQEILLEYDATNALLARYTHSGLRTDDVLAVSVTAQGQAEGLAQTAGSYTYLKDALGSVIDVADTSGNRVQHYVYSAYGEVLAIENSVGADVTASPLLNTTYTFAGRERDPESGFYYNRARYYDPGIGRFLQKDPHPGQLTIPASVVNSYIYAGNNPFNLTDPSGQFSWFERLIIGIVAAVIAVVSVALAPFTVGGSSFLGGVLEGALTGAYAGTLAGIGINVAAGRSWSDNLLEAAGIGAAVGAVAGGITAEIEAAGSVNAGNGAASGTRTLATAAPNNVTPSGIGEAYGPPDPTPAHILQDQIVSNPGMDAIQSVSTANCYFFGKFVKFKYFDYLLGPANPFAKANIIASIAIGVCSLLSP